MKTIKRTTKSIIGMILLLFTILFTGCQKESNIEMYDVSFTINAMSVNNPDLKSSDNIFNLKSALANPEEVTHVRITIDNDPITTFTLPYSITNGTTSPIKLRVGDHTLTNILLLKQVEISPEFPEGYEIIYSGVNEGAPLSQFITQTIPISFHVPLLNNVPVGVDVVALDHWTPEAFGWAVFNFGFITINEVYFYGADENSNPSIMNFEVYSGSNLISTSTLEPEGWYKVLYPDMYTITNNNESYTFMLIKDGIEYMRTYTVEELLVLPKEVILLDVFGSGMAGFEEVVTLTSVMFSWPNVYSPAGVGERFGFTVRNNMGIIVYQSNPTQGAKTFQFKNTIIPDNNEFYNITLTYQLWENGAGVWQDTQTRVANVNVSTLMAMSSPVSMGIYSDNYYWLFE